jgi:hypothetical protein
MSEPPGKKKRVVEGGVFKIRSESAAGQIQVRRKRD